MQIEQVLNDPDLLNFLDPHEVVEEISSLEDFVIHTEKHRSRVFFLGLEIYRRYNKYFNLVDESLLKEFLLLHDQAKILFVEDRYIFAHKLYNKYFGKDLKELDEKKKKEAKVLVKIINHYDNKMARSFFKSNDLIKDRKLTKAALQMKRIEQIADMIDRGTHPDCALEFGRQMKPASELLKDPFERLIALEMEHHLNHQTNQQSNQL